MAFCELLLGLDLFATTHPFRVWAVWEQDQAVRFWVFADPPCRMLGFFGIHSPSVRILVFREPVSFWGSLIRNRSRVTLFLQRLSDFGNQSCLFGFGSRFGVFHNEILPRDFGTLQRSGHWPCPSLYAIGPTGVLAQSFCEN